MSGGTITGNKSAGAGGGIGIRRGHGESTVSFTMTGGSVTDNIAQTARAAAFGLRVRESSIRPSENIKITGNKSCSTRDLGGGGIFVASDSTATIYNAIIKDNSAGGLAAAWPAAFTGISPFCPPTAQPSMATGQRVTILPPPKAEGLTGERSSKLL